MRNTRSSASLFAAMFVVVSSFASANVVNSEAATDAMFSNTSQSVVKKVRSNALSSNALSSVISPRKSTQDFQATEQLIHVALPSDNKTAQ